MNSDKSLEPLPPFASALALYLKIEDAKNKGVEETETEALLRKSKYADFF